MVYVNGKYFGNDATLFEENENKNLVDILRDFQGREDCGTCHGSGYTVCPYCRGGKKTFAELDPHVIEARIAKIGGVGVSFQLLFGCYSVAIGLIFTFSKGI
ncbi:hypothetical protein Y032_0968g3244 [Ancylostoma ceylanicum]|uniref:Glutaredoxin domain-containing protein n=1 Tax=Ancylostoma ceylanicum TaxID=53326 RepID=A0A016W992_9BILA|nr:hypothetical protein Y032_0968g3244 [Ancylostoma ceylanicum]